MTADEPGHRVGAISAGLMAKPEHIVVSIDITPLVTGIVERLAAVEERDANSPWLDVEAAAVYMACSPERVRKLVQRGAIPFHQEKRGGRVFFHRREIDDWLLHQ